MKPFRKNLALAIDGGGIRGTMVAQALAVVEAAEGVSFAERACLTAGTSTGSIISAALSVGLPAERIHRLYRDLAATIFPQSFWSKIWPNYWLLKRYRYSNRPLIDALKAYLGEKTMGELDEERPRKDLVIVLRDLVENRPRFVKPYKAAYADWPIWKAVLASSTVPTYFPVVDGRYIDGGVGSYGNPCYVAAYEIQYCIEDWDLSDTTLISIGTGTGQSNLAPGAVDRFYAWNWIGPLMDAFTVDATHQQVDSVQKFFDQLDFRRFNIALPQSISMDDTGNMDTLTRLGEQLGQMILEDAWEQPRMPDETVALGERSSRNGRRSLTSTCRTATRHPFSNAPSYDS